MAQVDIPMALGAAFWDKQKTALAKAAKAPPTKLADELKALTRLHAGVDWDGKDFTADNVKAVLAQLQTVVAALTKFETEAKKDKAFPKEPLTAVTAIDKAAKEYRGDIDAYVATRKSAAAKAAATAAAQKPKASPSAPGGAGASAKAAKLVRNKIIASIALLRKPKPQGAPGRPMRFLVVQGKLSTTLMMGVAVGPSQVKQLIAMCPGEAPYKTLKYPEAYLLWEKNALTFVSDKLSGSVVKKLQIWLKKTFKLNLKMRLRNAAGVVAEETEGEDLSDDMLKLDADDALSAEDAAQEYQERLAALAEAIRKAMAQPMGAKIKALMASSAQNAKANKYDAALGELDEIEALLEEGGLGEALEADESESEEELTNPAAKTGGNDAEAKKAELARAMDDWKARRAKAVASLKDVAGKIAASKHASATKAILEIQAVMKNITAEPATLQQVNELRKWLSSDDVVNDVCELAEDVRTPLLIPLERMRSLMA
ncbi:MAG: hypothetical protein K8R60_03295 [Burkholderiales bacterium]|nr:hypothetical protein [Burkholderiales bacterium]